MDNKAGKLLRILGSNNLPNEVIALLNKNEKAKLLNKFQKAKTKNIQEENSILTQFNSSFMKKEIIQENIELSKKINELLQIIQKEDKKDDLSHLKELKIKSEEDLKKILYKEKIEIIALTLSFSNPIVAANILEKYPEEIKEKIILEFENIDTSKREQQEKLDQFLRFKKEVINENLYSYRFKNHNIKEIVDILNELNPNSNSNLISKINQKNPKLAHKISSYCYKIDDLKDLKKEELTYLFSQLNIRVIAVFFKYIEKNLKEELYQKLSTYFQEKIQLEVDCIGPVSIEEIEVIQKIILNQLQAHIKNGKISFWKESYV